MTGKRGAHTTIDYWPARGVLTGADATASKWRVGHKRTASQGLEAPTPIFSELQSAVCDRGEGAAPHPPLGSLGITADRNLARYTLGTDDGKRSIVDFKALAPKQEPQWVDVAKQLPISEQPVKGSAACTYFADARTLYCNVHRIPDLAAPSKEMLALIKRNRPDKVAIDLRRNGVCVMLLAINGRLVATRFINGTLSHRIP